DAGGRAHRPLTASVQTRICAQARTRSTTPPEPRCAETAHLLGDRIHELGVLRPDDSYGDASIMPIAGAGRPQRGCDRRRPERGNACPAVRGGCREKGVLSGRVKTML